MRGVALSERVRSPLISTSVLDVTQRGVTKEQEPVSAHTMTSHVFSLFILFKCIRTPAMTTSRLQVSLQECGSAPQ